MLAKGIADGLRLAIVEVWKAETQQELVEKLKEFRDKSWKAP